MFSDILMAKSFTLGRTKCSYFINFRIAPYLKELLAKLKSSDFFVTCYDELLNWVLQEEQMDVVLRYFNNESCMVETSYFDSDFLKWPNSQKNLHVKLLEYLTAPDLGKLIQISMDGPHVNWDVLSLHSSYREKNALSRLTNIGSIGLHVLHGALKAGIMETDRKVSKVLQSM